jgi:FAD dependent oxidoreductase
MNHNSNDNDDRHISSSSSSSSSSTNNNVTYCDVVIVGAGVAGTSALYHLIRNCTTTETTETTNAALDIHIVDAGPAPGVGLETTSSSGTAVLSTGRCSKIMTQLYACSTEAFVEHHGTIGARRYLTATRTGLRLQKELAHTIESSSISSSSSSSSEDKDNTADNDREQQQPLLRQLGSFYLAYEPDEAALRREFEALVQLTTTENGLHGNSSIDDGLQWYNREQLLLNVPGCSRDFCSGIYLPNDAIIDSSRYARGLVQLSISLATTTRASSSSSRSSVTCHWNTQVVGIGTTPKDSDVTNTAKDAGAWVDFDSGMRLYSRHVVVATGAFFLPSNKQQQQHASDTTALAAAAAGLLSPTIASLLKPCYSYLVHVPILDATSGSHPVDTLSPMVIHNSSNFVTWGFTHDWCYVDGAVRTSGEDHYSAYKEDAHSAERCAKLIDWTWQIYHVHDANRCAHDTVPQQCGIYSETPDYVPLVGSVQCRGAAVPDQDDESCSPICYLVGCNAWGQAILSYAASLIPGLLGYRPLTDDERDTLRLLSIRRFSQLPVYE